MNQIIAVDFDGTLCENKWPEIGRPNARLIQELILLKDKGAKIILWTCRSGAMLVEAVDWCYNKGLTFDAVNDNVPESIEKFGSNSRKIFADVYYDDKAVTVDMF